jgi:hypothetical protein
MSDSPPSVSERDVNGAVDASPSPLPPLHIGTTLLDRFTIVDLLSSGEGANTYRAALTQPCPNCGVENEGGLENCGFCGKEMPAPRTLAII